ncbi:MAG: chromosomal replication initiator protein DnaA [Parcubacteria group bacterium]|nr:chromosomal replication initiator protein DnaA [Parcubacteria group bacterium]
MPEQEHNISDTKQLWDAALADIERAVSRANFTTWFKNTSIVKEADGVVYLGVPNGFVKEWLQNKYHKFILKSLRMISENIRGIDYIVISKTEQQKPGFAESAPQLYGELPLKDLYINKDDNLNPRYTFDTFVVGPFNELAYTATQAIMKSVGSVYNPLFVYGGTGLGKTHLLQATGNKIKEMYGDKKVFYITSEKFYLDLITSVQANKINVFKEKYRKYDVFIMDDIQFLSGKQGTQDELFHLFNTLYDNNKQIIFSSDKHYNFIGNLEERLKSRFGAGMIVDISDPDFESRVAILKTKSRHINFSPSDEIIEYIASNIKGSIRELEGLLNALVCQAQLKNRDLALLEVKTLLKNNEKPRKTLSVEDIVHVVSEFYNIEKSTIYEKTRKKEIVKPRQIIMYILREDLSISFPTIGQRLGGRDHTTVIHSCDKIKNDLKKDTVLVDELERIRSLFAQQQ